MLRVNLTGARVGMTLAMPVFHPTLAGHTLLRPGFVLDELTISRLTELHVGAIWIRYPALASVMKYISPAITMEHAAVTHLLGRLLDSARLGNGAGTAEMDFVIYAGAVRSLVGKLVAEPDAAILIGDLLCATSPLAMHSGNVCFLSLLIGLKLEAYLIEERRRVSSRAARAVESLGLGALLHDVGVERLSPEIRRKWLEGMSEDEPSWREHARLGYDLVRGKVEPSAAAVVLHHHQRFDGTGYPAVRGQPARALAGSEIHVFARIAAVADRFDALRNPVRGSFAEQHRTPVVRVLRMLLEEARSGAINPVVFKAMLHAAPAFAPGTIVRLNTGQSAVVERFAPGQPCRPVVRHVRYLGADMAVIDENLGETWDLAARREVWIIEAEGHDVERDLFDAQTAEEFDLRVLRPPARGVPGRGGKRVHPSLSRTTR